jgi:hypothetical protein
MRVIELFPEPYQTPPPPGFYRCAVRGCAGRNRHPNETCAVHGGDVTPGDIAPDVPLALLFPWRTAQMAAA